MKNLRRSAALVLSLFIASGLSSCNSEQTGANVELVDDIIDESISETANTAVTSSDGSEKKETEPAETVLPEGAESSSSEETVSETYTEASVTEQDFTYEMLVEALPEDQLKNKTVKWLSYYDPWYERGDPYHRTAAKLFEENYGGDIDVRFTTLTTRFSDLAVMILGGEGIDLYPDIESIPRFITNSMIQSYDDYVDWESPVWSSVKPLNDPYVINGKHYTMACHADVNCMVYYSKSTILNNGYEDPWELYKNGEWTMSKFMDMLEKFVDPDNERYGLDGWFNVTSLSCVGGLPAISLDNGRLVNNLSSPAFERSMNYQYELYQRGLVLDKSIFNYSSQEYLVSSGKELFCISFFGADLTGNSTSAPYEDITVVPVPRDDLADKYYHNARLDCYNLCCGAENPDGAVRLIECLIASYSDKNAKAETDNYYRTEYEFTDEMIERTDNIRRLVQENPVVDISNGLPSDIYSTMIEMINMPIEGTDWPSAKESANEALDFLISETNAEIASAVG